MPVRAAEFPWVAEPLPRGPHKLSDEDVRASQRSRLLRATLELVGANGYPATTVPQVVAAARVSRNVFYAQFHDKADCFLAACDQAGGEMLDSLHACAVGADWLTALRRGVVAYLRWWQDRPGFARAYLVELPALGHRATEKRDAQYARFRDMHARLAAWAREEQPGLPPLAPAMLDAAVYTPTEMIARRARLGCLDALGDLENPIVHLLVRLLADDATATRVAPA
jgi:AcrR family transcriptional regulator